jgi:parallel beta-helix repeat protein
VLEKDPHGVWILNAIIKVNPLAKLTINRTDTSWLKITNRILQENQSNFISISGSAKIDGVKITSWDPFSNNVIRQNAKGSIARPYIMINKGAGSVNVSNSEIAFLGNQSFTSNGLSYKAGGKGSSIINNTFHDMWDGFYSDSASFITIKNNKYYDNLRYGIDPHTGSHDLFIIGNLAYNNSHIGIICSESCYNIVFDNNTVHNNGVAGLMFSLDTNNSIAKKNYAYNEKVGFSVYSSSNDKVYNNLVKSSHTGIFIAGTSLGNHVYNNTMMDDTFGIHFGDNHPRNNVLENNNLKNITYPTVIIGTNNIGRNNIVYNK